MRSICSGVAIVMCALVAVPPVYGSSRGPDPSTSSGSSRAESRDERSAPQVTSTTQAEHVVSQALLDAAVQLHVRAVDRDRETVRLFLQRGDVRTIAGKAGIDIGRAETAVAAMDASDLAPLAAQARQAEEGLAGGASTVVISTTTIIIGLLVLILLIIALK